MAGKEQKHVADHHCILGLEGMLWKKMGDDIIVESHTATDYLPAGSNHYGTFTQKVHAVIKRTGKESEPEDLYMLAKLPPLTTWRRDSFNSTVSFKKETYFFENILPFYKNFEQKCGVPDDDLLDIAPAFYGSRLNLEFGGVLDDTAVILIEDLSSREYYQASRNTGLDIYHSKVIVKSLARFHAIGFAIKLKRPDFFNMLKVLPIGIHVKALVGSPKNGVNSYSEVFKTTEFFNDPTDEPEEPWSTIIHNEFWINNIMFHRNKATGLPDDVKFLDFQDYRVHSPLRDLCYVLGSLTDYEVSTKYIPELIDLYYDTLVNRLDIMRCDVTPFLREHFDLQLSKDTLLGFGHTSSMANVTEKSENLKFTNSQNPMTVTDLKKRTDPFDTQIRPLVAGYSNRG